MKKIYFAKNWGLTSRQMCSSYVKQTPDSSGIWKDIQVTYDIEDADYLIIEDNCSVFEASLFDSKTRLYFSREALDSVSQTNYPSDSFVRFSFWDGSGYLYTKWNYSNLSSGGINLNYDELKNEKPVIKKSLISTIQSNKMTTQTHRDRINFIGEVSKKCNLDIFGSIHLRNKNLEYNDKKSGLDDYKYSLSFDNQINIENFFGTQLTDSILRWTVPIYGGGAKLNNFFPDKSFIKIDPSDLNDVEKVIDLINNDDYEDRLEALTEARRLILDEYNIWPTIKKVIDNHEQ